MCSDALRLRSGLGEEVRCTRVPAVPLERCERLVDGCTDERMDEAERRLRSQDVDAREVGRRLRGFLLVQVGERGRVVGVDVLTEDRDRLREPVASGGRRERRTETARQPARAASSRRPGTLSAFGATPSARERAQQLVQEQRISTRDLVTGRAEGLVGVR